MRNEREKRGRGKVASVWQSRVAVWPDADSLIR